MPAPTVPRTPAVWRAGERRPAGGSAAAIVVVAGALSLAPTHAHAAAEARVHPENPDTTPELRTVTLPIPPGATALANADVAIWHCADERPLSPVCVPRVRAPADGNGDFPYLPSDDDDAEDLHAEVAAFFHATRAFGVLRGFGLPAVPAPLPIVVNVRLPIGWERVGAAPGALSPWAGAIYARERPFGGLYDAMPGWRGPALWIGQGVRADFAYDGDVVAHEVVHAAIDRVIPLTAGWRRDDQGAFAAAATWNEALADYFAAAIHGNPAIGEYAARDGAAARRLDGDRPCPAGVTGEPHADAAMLSGALWAARARVERARRVELDRAVWASLALLPGPAPTLTEIVAAIDAAASASSLSEARGLLGAELEARGLAPPCRRVLDFSGAPLSGPDAHLGHLFVAPGRDEVELPVGAAFAPGVVQFRVALPPGAERLRVALRAVAAASAPPGFVPGWLVSFAGPLGDFSDANVTSPPWPLASLVDRGGEWHGELALPPGAGELYAMIVNRGSSTGGYRDVAFFASTGGAGDDAAVTGGAGSSDGGASERAPRAASSGGCAIGRSAVGSNDTFALAGLAVALALRPRRRRARRRPRRVRFPCGRRIIRRSWHRRSSRVSSRRKLFLRRWSRRPRPTRPPLGLRLRIRSAAPSITSAYR